jgi:hypothetical protein
MQAQPKSGVAVLLVAPPLEPGSVLARGRPLAPQCRLCRIPLGNSGQSQAVRSKPNSFSRPGGKLGEFEKGKSVIVSDADAGGILPRDGDDFCKRSR